MGRDVVTVLEKNDCAVRCPEQVCCGMPFLDGGDIENARKILDADHHDEEWTFDANGALGTATFHMSRVAPQSPTAK